VLVQVERTGREQRDRGLIHAKDVEEHLVERLSVTRDAIAIKSAEDDGLEDVDLLDAGCPIEWIITKSALQEGWDCPFAYVLVSLSGTRSARAMTQLVGRVLRQPYQERAPCAALNECYVYCLRQTAGEVARQVEAALEKEGYDRDSGGWIVDASDGSPERVDRDRRRRRETRVEPRRAIEGAACDPGLRVKEGGETRRLDYFEDPIRASTSSGSSAGSHRASAGASRVGPCLRPRVTPVLTALNRTPDARGSSRTCASRC
jgi:type III restriction enzyme